MRTSNKNKYGTSNRALTLIELLVIVIVISMIAAVIHSGIPTRRHPPVTGIHCMSNLKQAALAFRLFAVDNGDRFPMRVSTNAGGSMEYTADQGAAFRHFLAMTNELNTPKILVCPSDNRTYATNFASLENTNVSYFVALDAVLVDPDPKRTRPPDLLLGDRHLSLDGKLTKGIVRLGTNKSVAWAVSLHPVNGETRGNVAFADGHAERITSAQFRGKLISMGDSTNRIALPQ